MTTTFEKKALLTGIGNGFFQIMTTEETPTTAPVYDSRVFEVPSLDKLKTKLEYKSKDIYLSSALHSVLGKASKATITLDAGYLPDGFEEEVSGATKLADGVYGMGGKGTKNTFASHFQ